MQTYKELKWKIVAHLDKMAAKLASL
jgi:hypothetical protein